ncbi:hypothetical protein [Christiangramia sp. LLG6405-1]|uniref:hypothetical protein n=1 Tax=Christiangramia sp. LLG6405-1 TaxID=3160832 RepID=UPI00386C31B1
MDKIKHFYGVDTSKSFFDVVDQNGIHDQFSNDSKGFKSFLKAIQRDSLIVMKRPVTIITGWLSTSMRKE